MMEVKGHVTTVLLLAVVFLVTTSVQGQRCQDAISGCRFYPDHACRAPYIGWAINNCKKRCGYCNYLPRGSGTCADKKPNCADFLKLFRNFCDGEYEGFAWNNCRWSCRKCSSKRKGIMNAMNNMIDSIEPIVNSNEDSITSKGDPMYSEEDSKIFQKSSTSMGSNNKGSMNSNDSEMKSKELPNSFEDSKSKDSTNLGNFKEVVKSEESINSTLDTKYPTVNSSDATTSIINSMNLTDSFINSDDTRDDIMMMTTKASMREDITERVTFKPPPPPECKDTIHNCSSYPESACLSPDWTVTNCPKRCNLCENPHNQAPPVKLPLCVDRAPGCGLVDCLGFYSRWARQYCTFTCRACGDLEKTIFAEPPETEDSSTTSSRSRSIRSSPAPRTTLLEKVDLPLPMRTLFPPLCEDHVQAGCDSIPDSKCRDDKMWAIPRCKKRCKICGQVADPCVDSGDCEQFGSAKLCNGYFRNWAKQYCPVTCGYCSS